MKRSTKQPEDRERTFERLRGLQAIVQAGATEQTEMAGFLAIMHPELSLDEIAEIVRDVPRKRR